MKNKIFNKILFVLFFSFLLSGCGEEFLTQYPQDKLSAAIFYKTDKDYVAAANSVYDAGIKAGNAEFIAWLECQFLKCGCTCTTQPPP